MAVFFYQALPSWLDTGCSDTAHLKDPQQVIDMIGVIFQGLDATGAIHPVTESRQGGPGLDR